jgi:hypothetical protein
MKSFIHDDARGLAWKMDPTTSCVALQVLLYTVFPAVCLGGVLMWLRLRHLARLSRSLHNAFGMRKAAVLANMDDSEAMGSGSAVSLMSDLKSVYRFRDVRQVRLRVGPEARSGRAVNEQSKQPLCCGAALSCQQEAHVQD